MQRRARQIAKKILPPPVRSAIRTALRGGGEDQKLIPGLVERFCTGQGIEVGAGPSPYCSPKNTVFLDKHTSNHKGTPNADIVADAAAIPRPDDHFDFLLSAHCLEHAQNTIKTLKEWIRVIKPGGVLFLILPHGDRTLDLHRPKTTLEHHIQDHETLTDEWDRSHCEEIEKGWSALDDFDERTARFKQRWGGDYWDWDFRFRNDVIHFHVWTQDEIVRLLQYMGLKIAFVEEHVPERRDSFVVIARKP